MRGLAIKYVLMTGARKFCSRPPQVRAARPCRSLLPAVPGDPGAAAAPRQRRPFGCQGGSGPCLHCRPGLGGGPQLPRGGRRDQTEPRRALRVRTGGSVGALSSFGKAVLPAPRGPMLFTCSCFFLVLLLVISRGSVLLIALRVKLRPPPLPSPCFPSSPRVHPPPPFTLSPSLVSPSAAPLPSPQQPPACCSQ